MAPTIEAWIDKGIVVVIIMAPTIEAWIDKGVVGEAFRLLKRGVKDVDFAGAEIGCVQQRLSVGVCRYRQSLVHGAICRSGSGRVVHRHDGIGAGLLWVEAHGV